MPATPERCCHGPPMAAYLLFCLTLVGVLTMTQAVPEVLISENYETLTEIRKACLWSRTGVLTGTLVVNASLSHEGTKSMLLTANTTQDWSYNCFSRQSVRAGDRIEIGAWVRIRAGGGTYAVNDYPEVDICAIAYAGGQVVTWCMGNGMVMASAPPTTVGSYGAWSGWTHVVSKFYVPVNVTSLQIRAIGYKPSQVRIDEFLVSRTGHLDSLTPTLSTNELDVRVDLSSGKLSVLDKRAGLQATAGQQWLWEQTNNPWGSVSVNEVSALTATNVTMEMFMSGLNDSVFVTVSVSGAEVSLTMEARRPVRMQDKVRFPHPFVTNSSGRVILPMNEGISYPLHDPDPSIPNSWVLWSGHGMCMAFTGIALDNGRSYMFISETPDDARYRLTRMKSDPSYPLFVVPEWTPQKNYWGYTRRLRYVFFNKGGYVAMCKRYRQHALETGLLVTLKEKRAKNPNVDLLVGAVDLWAFAFSSVKTAIPLVQNMTQWGASRILWSAGGSAELINALNNKTGVLTSMYDIYSDVMNPAMFPYLKGKPHPQWTTEAWPGKLLINETGDWVRGWEVELKDSSAMTPCGVMCDTFGAEFARKRIRKDLNSTRFTGRFIDTVTASGWKTCWNESHPMTHTQSKQYKMELLDVVSKEFSLVTGSETGHEAAIPHLHFFEGMMSLGPYRVKDAGRNLDRIVNDVPPQIARFQVNPYYRLPLVELVYHDAIVSYWYWGDTTNKVPLVWDQRDLINVLYGTPPVLLFNQTFYWANQQRIRKTIQTVCPVARRFGYDEMTDHLMLKSDWSVQRSVFAGKTAVTVNFGSSDFLTTEGWVVPAKGFIINELSQYHSSVDDVEGGGSSDASPKASSSTSVIVGVCVGVAVLLVVPGFVAFRFVGKKNRAQATLSETKYANATSGHV